MEESGKMTFYLSSGETLTYGVSKEDHDKTLNLVLMYEDNVNSKGPLIMNFPDSKSVLRMTDISGIHYKY